MADQVTLPVTRDNHFVPRALMKRWSPDNSNVWTFSLLVPDERVPLWQLKSIRASAYRRDLYTTLEDGRSTDAVEDEVQLVLRRVALNVAPDVGALAIREVLHDPVFPPAVGVARDQLLLNETSHGVRVELQPFAQCRVVAPSHEGDGISGWARAGPPQLFSFKSACL